MLILIYFSCVITGEKREKKRKKREKEIEMFPEKRKKI
jgi:hypothetical protein